LRESGCISKPSVVCQVEGASSKRNTTIHNDPETSMTIAKPLTAPVKKWATMDNRAKAIFLAKLTLMICSFGFIFGGVLVEGMVYDKLPDA
jgi:hypothetical protein